MLTVSKPTVFSSDGLAARGQCNHDSPGWQLRWFDRETPAVMIWQGAYKTCRHLQHGCQSATTIDEVRKMVEELLNANTLGQFASQPTDAYPTPSREERDAGREGHRSREDDSGQSNRKKRKRRRR